MSVMNENEMKCVCPWCSAGVGRTGVFIALSIVLERMRYEGIVDMFQTVKLLRAQRPSMVQNEVGQPLGGLVAAGMPPSAAVCWFQLSLFSRALSIAAQCIVIGPVCGGRAGGDCYHDNSRLRASIFTKLGL